MRTHRRFSLPVAGMALWLASASSAAASLSVQDYLDIALGRKQGVDSSLLLVYLWGAFDALLISNQMAETLGTPKYFCEPAHDIELSMEDFKAMVDEQLERLRLNQDFEARARAMSVGQLALATLAERFPCTE